MVTTLSSGHVDVWFCFTEDPQLQGYVHQYEAMLSEAESMQHQQFPQSAQRHDYLVSRALLRSVLADYCQVEAEKLIFGVNAYGKPELQYPANSPIQFNTAHAHGLTVCVVTRDCSVGVDAECHSDSHSLLKVADDYFSTLELEKLNALKTEEAKLAYFFQCWTLKEAYLKARGQGLSVALHDFSVVLEGTQFKEFLGPDAQQWDFRLLGQDENYTAALAMAGKINSLRLLDCIPLGPAVELEPSTLSRKGFPGAPARRS